MRVSRVPQRITKDESIFLYTRKKFDLESRTDSKIGSAFLLLFMCHAKFPRNLRRYFLVLGQTACVHNTYVEQLSVLLWFWYSRRIWTSDTFAAMVGEKEQGDGRGKEIANNRGNYLNGGRNMTEAL